MEDRLPLNDSRIPVARAQERTLRRSASVRLRGERRTQHFPAIAESTDSWTQPATHGSLRSLAPMPPGRDNGSLDDDLDSLASYGSVASCDHAYFARNGTTFSGRQMKYVVHCSSHGGATEEYLTPTQRANRQIRRLSALLQQTERDLEKKNLEIGRLTQEVVELRLSQGSKKDITIPEDSTQDLNTSKDIITYQYNGTLTSYFTELKQIVPFLCSNIEDEKYLGHTLPLSGSNFAEVTTKNQELSVESPDSGRHERSHASSLGDSGLFEDLGGTHVSAVEEREGEYELRLEKLLRNHSDQTRELKERHNDKVEELLMRLTDVNNRYCELRAEHDQALDKLHQSNKERDVLRRTLEEQEERHKSMYLKMYLKGQEAARFEHADQVSNFRAGRGQVLEFAHKAPERVSVPELLQQLQDARNELDSMKGLGNECSLACLLLSLICSCHFRRVGKGEIRGGLSQGCGPVSKEQDCYIGSLLSAREAVSLWLLGTRKAMYRRLVESRANKGDLDPEITLQFLKSAVYYLLTDRENHQGHLNAIQSILGYTDTEKLNIDKAYKLYLK
uniref:GRIP domain-containing protein n=1 Tax=Timema poppense TaxID=170557 RepID=A0A7R9H3Z1_TIMPO|nr:unnamed protein product [Timema poppensis]